MSYACSLVVRAAGLPQGFVQCVWNFDVGRSWSNTWWHDTDLLRSNAWCILGTWVDAFDVRVVFIDVDGNHVGSRARTGFTGQGIQHVKTKLFVL